MSRTSYVSGAAYVLGEERKSYEQADGFAQALEAMGMANFPALWGWGHYHETRDIYALAIQAAQNALVASAVAPADIDLVVFAAAAFPENPNQLSSILGKALQSMGCVNALLEGSTLAGCASLLAAVRLGAARVGSGELNHVLVIGLGSMTPGIARFSSFAVFGDAACALVLGADPAKARYRVVDAIQKIDLNELASGVSLDSKSMLQVETVDTLLERNQTSKSDVKKLFNNNVFLPVKKIKDARSGFKTAQLFTDNVARIGHCHACDSVINLIDYRQNAAPANQELFLLQSDGGGHSVCLLLAST
ncbi:MAG: hypothetical protein V4754_07085 [Pseudomonadota bacterium]